MRSTRSFHSIALPQMISTLTDDGIDMIADGDCRIYIRRIDRAERMTARDAERAAVAAIVRDIFGEGATIGHSADGAPVLMIDVKEASARISVSHGAGRAVVAVRDNGATGVDIEAPREQLLRVESRIRHAKDSRTLSPLELWTAKEATFKAAEIASLTLPHIAVTDDGVAEIYPAKESGAWGKRFRISYHTLDGALIALALPE